nr:pentatricopeptide repeat-containing protein At2g22070 [Tanacetum cinerariifolium]
MGPKRCDYAGTKVFLRHRSYEADVAYMKIESGNTNAGANAKRTKVFWGLSKDSDRVICRAKCDICNTPLSSSQLEKPDPKQESNWKGWFLSIGAAVISCRNEKAPDGLVADAHLADGFLHLILIKDCPCFLVDARQVFDEMPDKNPSSWNTIISAYAKQGQIDNAQHVFKLMPKPDFVSWTAIMVGYNQMGWFENAVKLFVDMIWSKVMPTQYTFTIVLALCAAMKSLEIGRKVHSFIVKVGVSSYTSVVNYVLNVGTNDMMKVKSTSSWNTMISMHMQCKRFDLALAQFEKMTDRDIVTWNSMISSYNQHGFDIEVLDMFSIMLKDPLLKPDKYTLSSVLSACANLNEVNSGKQIHCHLIRTELDLCGAAGNALTSMYSKFGDVKIAQKIVEQNRISNLNIIAFTALLDGYIKQADMNPARRIFDLLRDRDVVAWTAMIVGYMQNGFNNEAMDIFRSMIKEGPQPNSYTLAAILSVGSSLASLDHGKQIHARAIKSEYTPSVSVSNALINMYAKSENSSNAKRVFDTISCLKDTVSWTSMVISLAQHGLKYGVQLKRGPFDKRIANYVWMFFFGALSLLVVAVIPFFRFGFMGTTLVFMIIYVWSRELPNTRVNIQGLVELKGFYLPWAMVAIDLVLGNQLMSSLLGIGVGHLYYVLTVLYPLAGAANFCKTPLWTRNTSEGGISTTTPPNGGAFSGRGGRLNAH